MTLIDAAGVTAVLGLVARGLDFDFLDELVVDVFALDALDDVRRVDAVDQEAVLGRGRAVDRDRERAALGLAVVGLDARLREHDVGIVAARQRQLVDDLARKVRAGRRRSRVDQWRVARDDDFGRRREVQLQVGLDRGVEADRGLLLHFPESGQGRGDRVVAGSQVQETVVPVRRRHGGPASLNVHAGELHGHARQRGSALVGDAVPRSCPSSVRRRGRSLTA